MLLDLARAKPLNDELEVYFEAAFCYQIVQLRRSESYQVISSSYPSRKRQASRRREGRESVLASFSDLTWLEAPALLRREAPALRHERLNCSDLSLEIDAYGVICDKGAGKWSEQ